MLNEQEISYLKAVSYSQVFTFIRKSYKGEHLAYNCKESALYVLRNNAGTYSHTGKILFKGSTAKVKNYLGFINSVERILKIPKTTEVDIVERNDLTISFAYIENAFWYDNLFTRDILNLISKIYLQFPGNKKTVKNWEDLSTMIKDSYFNQYADELYLLTIKKLPLIVNALKEKYNDIDKIFVHNGSWNFVHDQNYKEFVIKHTK